mmetsp:Transcript_2841/g.8582  ORF Transcript_2841/g.8582 Transcript_2841/m.8582 type:complete len:207 (+) Transcript_2841:1567-2187(+)
MRQARRVRVRVRPDARAERRRGLVRRLVAHQRDRDAVREPDDAVRPVVRQRRARRAEPFHAVGRRRVLLFRGRDAAVRRVLAVLAVADDAALGLGPAGARQCRHAIASRRVNFDRCGAIACRGAPISALEPALVALRSALRVFGPLLSLGGVRNRRCSFRAAPKIDLARARALDTRSRPLHFCLGRTRPALAHRAAAEDRPTGGQA